MYDSKKSDTVLLEGECSININNKVWDATWCVLCSNGLVLARLTQQRMNLPKPSSVSLQSSTSIICLRNAGGDLERTLWTVRSNVDQASLWNIIITLAVGRIIGYCIFKHLGTIWNAFEYDIREITKLDRDKTVD